MLHKFRLPSRSGSLNLGPDGIIYTEGEGDGKGKIWQTSNMLSGVFAMIGREIGQGKRLSGVKLFVEMFAPQFGAAVGACRTAMKVLQYTDQAAEFWCNALPSGGR